MHMPAEQLSTKRCLEMLIIEFTEVLFRDGIKNSTMHPICNLNFKKENYSGCYQKRSGVSFVFKE